MFANFPGVFHKGRNSTKGEEEEKEEEEENEDEEDEEKISHKQGCESEGKMKRFWANEEMEVEIGRDFPGNSFFYLFSLLTVLEFS